MADDTPSNTKPMRITLSLAERAMYLSSNTAILDAMRRAGIAIVGKRTFQWVDNHGR